MHPTMAVYNNMYCVSNLTMNSLGGEAVFLICQFTQDGNLVQIINYDMKTCIGVTMFWLKMAIPKPLYLGFKM